MRQAGAERGPDASKITAFWHRSVEYVKICSIYGAGFFYIPGTDTCIKIGGWVRFEADFNAGGSHNPATNGGFGRNNRIDTQDVTLRDRFVISNDIRTQ